MRPPGVAVFDGNHIFVDGRPFLSAREIARKHGCVRDYVTRLCRQGKVQGRRLGMLWYVDADSFAAFIHRTDSTEAHAPHPSV